MTDVEFLARKVASLRYAEEVAKKAAHEAHRAHMRAIEEAREGERELAGLVEDKVRSASLERA